MARAAALLLLAACAAPPSVGLADAGGAAVAPFDLRTDDQVEPIGIDTPTPRLSWRLRATVDSTGDATGEACRQTAYHLVAAASKGALQSAPDFDSGEVQAAWSPHVAFGGRPLTPGERGVWRVRVRDGAGRWSAWSPPAAFVQGPRDEADWPGPWLGMAPRATLAPQWIWHAEARSAPPPPGRRCFRARAILPAPIRDPVRLYVHADDRAVVWLNGREVVRGGSWDTALAADVTDLLRPGPNVVAVEATNDGVLSNPAGVALLLLAQGSTRDDVLLTTDAGWQATATPSEGWQTADDLDATWSAACVVPPQTEWLDALAAQTRGPDPRLRRRITLSTTPARAVLHVASVGYHAVFVNGERVAGAELAPHVSDLRHRARYTSYDITKALRAGDNMLGLELGRGWAQSADSGLGGHAQARVRLDLFDARGGHEVVGTDAGWQAQPGARTLLGGWRFRDFGGERVEMAKQREAWCEPDASRDRGVWQPASTVGRSPVRSSSLTARGTAPTLAISADGCARNRAGAPLSPREIRTEADGAQRVDFGRAATGLVEVTLNGAPGARVGLSMSERPDERASYAQRSECVLDADGKGTFRHRFNFVAGRWLTVEGAEPLTVDDVRLLPIANDLAATTTFACDHDLLNEIWHTTTWTLRNLTLGGYIVDCPHRERLGYGGDAHATMQTMLAAFDAAAFYRKWLQDWRDVQQDDGDLPPTAPTRGGGGGPAWSGIVVMLPWAVYVETGDAQVLAANFATMQRWVAFLTGRTEDGLLARYGDPEWGFCGDWVPPGRGQGPQTRVPDEWTLFFNNCYWIDTLTTMAKVAAALGHTRDAADYRTRADAARAAVRARFFDDRRGEWITQAQPYLALVLRVGLAEGAAHAPTVRSLADAIGATLGHIDAGIHGTAYLLQQLTAEARDDLAYAMVTKTDYPSWGHMLARGATTLWEQWDGENSRLHSSFVSVGAWFVRGLAGIRADPEHPGYAQFTLAPAVVGDLTWVACRHECVRGSIESRWRIDGADVVYEFVVPPGTRAQVVLPTAAARIELDGRQVSVAHDRATTAEFVLGPGAHRVRARRPLR